jgi:hypothetical protein
MTSQFWAGFIVGFVVCAALLGAAFYWLSKTMEIK